MTTARSGFSGRPDRPILRIITNMLVDGAVTFAKLASGLFGVAPVDIGTANAEGAAETLARSNHVHNHPSGLGATLHHDNFNDHAESHPHASHTGIGTDDHHAQVHDHIAQSLPQSLTNDTPASANTWEDWGTETIRVVTSGTIGVLAFLSGYAQDFSSTEPIGQVRIGISHDDGATFNFSTAPLMKIVGGTVSDRIPFSTFHSRRAAVTTAIVIKAQIRSDQAGKPDFMAGQLQAIIESG